MRISGLRGVVFFSFRSRRPVVVVAVLVALAVAATATSVSAGRASESIPQNITVAYLSKMQTLDPDIAVDFPGEDALHLIGGNLFEVVDGHTKPGLASREHLSRNGLTWTFTLRPNLRFSNGMPLRSRDVVATFRHAVHDPADAFKYLVNPIKSVRATNSRTVVIVMKRRFPSWPTYLGVPALAIFPASMINQKGFFDHPVSAGPYKLSSWGGTDTAIFVRNRYYWGHRSVVPKVTFETIPDANSAIAEVESGQVDIAYGLAPQLLSQVNQPAVGKLTSMYGSEVMTMRDTTAPLNNQRVRVAISDAVDRQQMARVVWGNRLKALPGFWSSPSPGYDPSLSTSQNLRAAKKSLAGTSCAKGCTMTLNYSSAAYPEQGPEALIIKSNLARIGIKVNLVNLDPNTYFNLFATYKFQLLLYPLFDNVNAPDNLLGSAILRNGGQQAGYTGVGFPKLERLAETIDTNSGARRAKALHAINVAFLKISPFVSLTNYGIVWVTRISPSIVHVSTSDFIDFARQ